MNRLSGTLTRMDADELANRFKFHPATTDQVKSDHEEVRSLCGALAHDLNELLPEGREKALAMTNLEHVMMWANAAIARAPRGADQVG